jgi:hypothetical protein
MADSRTQVRNKVDESGASCNARNSKNILNATKQNPQ